MSDIWERCAKTLAAITGADASTITEESSPDNLEGWDSLAHIAILGEIEVEYGIRFRAADIVNLPNVGALQAVVDKKVKAKG